MNSVDYILIDTFSLVQMEMFRVMFNLLFVQFLDLEATWSVSGIDDTWLLVLVASSIGVLLLGALLAMFLLKCRE